MWRKKEGDWGERVRDACHENPLLFIAVACVAGVRKGRGTELGRETAREGEGRKGITVSYNRRPSSTSHYSMVSFHTCGKRLL